MFLLKTNKSVDNQKQITGYRISAASHHDTDRYMTVDETIYNYVVFYITDNDLYFDEVLEEVVSTDEIILKPVDSLMKMKNNAIAAYALQEFSHQIDISFFMVVMRFIMLTSDLFAAGYFITDTNKEEKYLDILNSGDPKLIECLEDYLSIIDVFADLRVFMDNYFTFDVNLKSCNTSEEVITAFADATGGKDLTEYVNS